jgi:hypothetical protein
MSFFRLKSVMVLAALFWHPMLSLEKAKVAPLHRLSLEGKAETGHEGITFLSNILKEEVTDGVRRGVLFLDLRAAGLYDFYQHEWSVLAVACSRLPNLEILDISLNRMCMVPDWMKKEFGRLVKKNSKLKFVISRDNSLREDDLGMFFQNDFKRCDEGLGEVWVKDNSVKLKKCCLIL